MTPVDPSRIPRHVVDAANHAYLYDPRLAAAGANFMALAIAAALTALMDNEPVDVPDAIWVRNGTPLRVDVTPADVLDAVLARKEQG